MTLCLAPTLLVALGLVACASAHPAHLERGVDVPRPPSSSGPASIPARAAEPMKPAAILIDDGGVGSVRIGSPIAPADLGDDTEARTRYEIRWIADAQPFEAFRAGEARVLAAFKGPFTRFAESNVGPPEAARFVEQALRDVRAGAPVESIVVDAPGPLTRAGIGVGSSWAALLAAYPSAKVRNLPEWFESILTCVAEVKELSRVRFQLAPCDKGKEPGEVIRVVITRED